MCGFTGRTGCVAAGQQQDQVGFCCLLLPPPLLSNGGEGGVSNSLVSPKTPRLPATVQVNQEELEAGRPFVYVPVSFEPPNRGNRTLLSSVHVDNVLINTFV